MKFITQFLLILAFSFAGELLHWLLPLPVPASIHGIALLFAALLKGWVRVSDVREVSTFLIAVMPVMFIPAAPWGWRTRGPTSRVTLWPTWP